MKFSKAIIDEAANVMETLAYIPIVKGLNQLVLIGDHKQQDPFVQCAQAGKQGLNLVTFTINYDTS